MTAGNPWRDAFHQKHQFVPAHGTESYALTQKYEGMEAATLKAFIIHHISATLPMQQFHYSAAFTYEYIYIAIGRVQTGHTYLAAHPVYPDTHVTRML